MGILRVDKLSGLETPTAVTGSVSFDGNDHLSIGSAGDFNFLHNGATDWTAEFWAKIPSNSRHFVFGTGASSAQTGFSFEVMTSSDGQSATQGVFAMYGRGAAGNYRYFGVNNVLSLNTWHHIAAVFKTSDKTLTIYVDGKEVVSSTGTASGSFGTGDYSSSNSSYAFTVAKNIHGSAYLTGDISNLRVVAGRRLYTSNFTPPVHALEPISGTRILCCNNPDSVTAVSNTDIGKGYTATASGDPTVSTDNPSLTRDFTSGTEFNGVTTFDTQGFFVVPSGTTEQRDKSGGRGIIAGTDNGIQYITISSFGNSQDFGDLTYSAPYAAGCASHTRGLIAGGYNAPTGNNTINAITISTTGNAINFGDIPQTVVYGMGGCSSSTRGLFAGGFKAPSPNAEAGLQQINYVTIASLGDAQDFGDLTNGVRYPAGTSSPTRAIFAGGRDTPSGNKNIISYVTIASTGNATDFGDLTVALYSMGGTGSATRGLFTGGYNPAGSPQDTMDYVTIASTGNAQDFGNLSLARGGVAASSNPTRATFAGGSNPSAQKVIDYVEIQSTGDAKNFGDLYSTRYAAAGFSNSHGGLS